MTNRHPARNLWPLATLVGLVVFLLIATCHSPTEPSDDDQILPFRIIDSEPSWSPDGETIAYIHDQTIDSTGQWSPDTSGIYLINTDGTNKRLLLLGLHYSPDWSPDGEWIVFNQGTHIYKIKADGDSLTQLTFEGRNFFPAFSPDGKWIVYDNTNCGSVVEPAPPNSCGVLMIESSKSDKQFVVKGRMPDWSPDGKYLIYLGLHREIYRVNVNDTADVVRLTSLNQVDIYATDNRYPKYSPDENKILFVSQAKGSRPQLWVMDSSGKNLIQLTEDGGWAADWSPEDHFIVFTHPLDGRLWLMDSKGENMRQLTFSSRLILTLQEKP